MKTPEQIAEEMTGGPTHDDNDQYRVFPVRHLAKAIASAIQAERDHATILLGTCSVCGYIAWQRDGSDPRREHCQYCKLVAGKDQVATPPTATVK